MEEKLGLPGGSGHLGPAFSAAPEAEDQTSDAPVALRNSPGLTQGSYEEPRTASIALASTRAAFPARSAFHRHVRRPHSQASPATDPRALPPRSGFRRSFAPPMLSHERARSSSIARAIGPGSRGPRAACRLLQSKRSLSTTARSIEPRSPRPRSPSSAAPCLPIKTAFAARTSLPAGWPSSFQSSAS
jgi:hypothetical protein